MAGDVAAGEAVPSERKKRMWGFRGEMKVVVKVFPLGLLDEGATNCATKRWLSAGGDEPLPAQSW